VLANSDPSIQLCVHRDFDEGGTRRTTDDCVKFPVRPSIGNFTRKYSSQQNSTPGTIATKSTQVKSVSQPVTYGCFVQCAASHCIVIYSNRASDTLPGLSRVINSLLTYLLTYWCAYTCEIGEIGQGWLSYTHTYTRVYLDDFSVIPMVIPIPIDIPIARQDSLLLCLAVPFATWYNAKTY